MSSNKKTLKKKSRLLQDDNVVEVEESSSDSSEHETICYGMVPQEHARPRLIAQHSSISRLSFIEAPDALSKTSITSSLARFRNDFETFKCKIRIFGESVNLCSCISDDYRSKLDRMERRLIALEKRQKLFKKGSNYSMIIQKNKLLAHKSKKDIKVQHHLN